MQLSDAPLYFFFSSRRRHTRWPRDWSSDVCSSDLSRSGGTITAGLLLGYSRKSAARYAFLLAVPAVFASGLYKAAKEVPALLSADGRAAAAAAGEPSLLAIIVATLVSLALGYMVIVWFMRLIETRTYLVFVVYRVIAGLVLLGLLMGGVIDPLAGT